MLAAPARLVARGEGEPTREIDKCLSITMRGRSSALPRCNRLGLATTPAGVVFFQSLGRYNELCLLVGVILHGSWALSRFHRISHMHHPCMRLTLTIDHSIASLSNSRSSIKCSSRRPVAGAALGRRPTYRSVRGLAC